MKIAVDRARNKQSFALAALFQFFINWPDVFGDKPPIFFRRFAALFELPLAFEERCLVDESEHVLQRNVVNYARAKERRIGNRRVGLNVRADGVGGVAGKLRDTARSRRFLDAKLGVFANEIVLFRWHRLQSVIPIAALTD